MNHDLPYQLGQRLSEGLYANIYLCRQRRSSAAEVYAIKVIDKQGIIEAGRQTQKQIDGEVRLHKLCGTDRHAHIIDFIAADETPAGYVWICMEFASGGDLFDKIEPDLGLEEDIAQLYFKQMLAGLQFIHAKGVSHRDIKPENILLDADGRLKIADFGLAALYQYQGKRRMLSTCCGSPPYAAPEILSSYDGEKVDVWSAGVVLFALCLGSTPWNEPTSQCSLFRQFARSRGAPRYEPWDRLSPGVFDLLQHIFSIDPMNRYTLADISAHKWVARHIPTPDPLTLANTLMSRLQVDLTQPPPGSQVSLQATPTSLSQQMGNAEDEEMVPTTQVARQPQLPINFVDDDPALSQYTASSHVLESLTQRARRFADITGSDRLTRFFSLWPMQDLSELLSAALTHLQISHRPDPVINETSLRVKALDTTGCQLLGHLTLHQSSSREIVIVEFTKRKGDPQQFRRLFKIIVYQCREAVYTG